MCILCFGPRVGIPRGENGFREGCGRGFRDDSGGGRRASTKMMRRTDFSCVPLRGRVSGFRGMRMVWIGRR